MKEFYFDKIYDSDLNRGEIYSYLIKNFVVCTETITYPSLRFKNDQNLIINPYFEKVMSMETINSEELINYKKNINITKKEKNPLFFMCYNFGNYFHFIYDTLPYFLTYIKLKKKIKNLKLLIPNENLNKYVLETLDLLSIEPSEMQVIEHNVEYFEIYFSDSYTHGFDSNIEPHKETKNIYNLMIEKVNNLYIKEKIKNDLVKSIYISRRSWIHNDQSNLGTNYTNRRKLVNEDDLVGKLNELGFDEIFTEKLTMVEKIILFNSCSEIIAPIGGGLVNCLFSKKDTNLVVINSPYFLEINKRFENCYKHLNYHVYNETKHHEKTKWKSNQRVYCENKKILGEIIKQSKTKLFIKYTNSFISGFNNSEKYKTKWISKKDIRAIDPGLNSPFFLNLKDFKKFYKNLTKSTIR